MKITRLTVWSLDLPLSKPYSLSGGRLHVQGLDSTIIRIDTDEGVSGWGEGCPWGHTYLPAHGPGIRAGIETLAPFLIGLDPTAPEAVLRAMDVALPGHQSVKSPIDIASWDITGKAAGMPLWKLFGADKPAAVAVNSSIPTGSPEEMIASVEQARVKGYRTHSIKIGGSDPSADIERIEALSAAKLRGENMTFDVNRAWMPATAVEVLNSVRSRDWIEQPCETLSQCAHVAGRVRNPIMLDECLQDVGTHIEAWRLGACEGVKVKPNRLGGLTRARQVRDFGISVGWQMHIEDVGGSALADTAALHLAASTPDANRLASWLSHDHLVCDPVPGQGARNDGGTVTMPAGPGLGVAPDVESLGVPVAVYGN
jgi:L-alanine-DL-glutamate epimerase-like enolase superfamily enzyme